MDNLVDYNLELKLLQLKYEHLTGICKNLLKPWRVRCLDVRVPNFFGELLCHCWYAGQFKTPMNKTKLARRMKDKTVMVLYPNLYDLLSAHPMWSSG